MIPARGNYSAVYRDNNGTELPSLPVEAFDDEGHALVVNAAGRLVRADAGDGFTSVDHQPPIVAVIPGGGWKATFSPDGSTIHHQVVGWAVTDTGRADPLILDDDGKHAHLPARTMYIIEPGAESSAAADWPIKRDAGPAVRVRCPQCRYRMMPGRSCPSCGWSEPDTAEQVS